MTDGSLSAAAHRTSVLVVDDEPGLLRAMYRDITASGMQGATAGDPVIAVAMLEVRHFDIVLCDLRLFLPDGILFAAKVAQLAPATAIVVITGEDSLRRIDSMLGSTVVDGLLPKPYTCATMLRTLRRAVRHRRQGSGESEAETRLIADGLVRALALRDIETENHSRRVAAWARILGEAVGLRDEALLQCELGALLHDVGKIGVPDAILRKPDRLTHDEWVEMRKHPGYGRDMLSGIERLEDASEVVYSHHERWEGGGYPRNLRGVEIPIGARIFSVVDSYDAMTSDRVYRKGMPHALALAEIQRLAGTQYDPQVVQVFLGLDQDAWQAVRVRFRDDDVSERAA